MCWKSIHCLVLLAGALTQIDQSLWAFDEPAPKNTNRLAQESSPYLLLHAHNPVDWFPWGDEALAKAKVEKKLIFLSVGYSSCFWCHVMERESFSDDEIAKFLNEHFVCIKVDREERPDIDEVYMQALRVYLQLAGAPGGGGWPLSMFLTSDAKPLVGGTYFPPRDREGQMGFLSILRRIEQSWTDDRAKWQASADSLADIVAESLHEQPPAEPVRLEAALVDTVLASLAKQFDPQHGGFGFDANNPRQPKFPEPSNLNLLIELARTRSSDSAGQMLQVTLENIAAGGIRDHVAGGFHRYSTDRFWRVPHFEKMLYDNGQLASNYARAYELAPREDFQRVVDETLGFVQREMTDPRGAFYSAMDAETDGHEGLYYLWTREELEKLLTADEWQLFSSVYGLQGPPNFEERYILLLPRSLAEAAKARNLSETALAERLSPIRAKLLAARNERKRPLADTKILAGWNGLMIRGFADAGRVFKRPDYNLAAMRAANFVSTKMRDSQGHLQHSYGNGQTKIPAYLDDYAYYVDGLVALHQSTGERTWLAAADQLMQLQLKLFWDEKAGGFFHTSTEHEVLIARSKAAVDNVTPSGNSQSALNLVYLAHALDKPEYLRAEQCIQSAAPMLRDHPTAVPQLAVALSRWLAATQAAKPVKD